MRPCLTLLCAFFLASCAGGSPDQSIRAHVLRIADLSDPSSLDPLLAHDQDTIGYDLLVCQTLIGLDGSNRLVPMLVTRVPTRANGDVSADGLRIIYHLRRGVRFADGTPLTSADVAFTYRAIVDSRNNVLSSDAYRRIESVQTPDRQTVVVTLRHPWNAAVSDLFAQSDFAFGILPAHAFSSTLLANAPWERQAFGTGPFRVVQWRRGDRIVLMPNPYFSPKPKLRQIVLRMIPSETSAFIALQSHDVDIAPIQPQTLAQARQIPGVFVRSTPENATIWLSLQTRHHPTSDLRVRRAIAAALDLSALRKATQGAYSAAAAFLPPVLPWHDKVIQAPRRDLSLARALLRGQKTEAVLVLPAGNPLYVRMATIVQQQLAAAAIAVTIKTFPVTVFNAPEGPIRNERFTISIEGWLGGADPEQSIVFTCAQATRDGDNISRYCNPRFEQLFADQQITPTEARRRADFIGMQRLIRDDVPVIPIYYERYFDGVDNRISGFERNMLRFPVNPETWDAGGSAVSREG